MIEPDHKQAPAAHLLMPTMATARAHLRVQIGDRGGRPFVMSAHHCSALALTAEGVHHADVLDRPQHQIPARHPVPAVRATKQLPRVGVAPLEDAAEGLRRGDPVLPERRCAGPVPSAW